MLKGIKKILAGVVSLCVTLSLCPSAALALGSNSGGGSAGSSVANALGVVADESVCVVQPNATPAYKNLKAAGLKFDLKPTKEVTVKQYLANTTSNTFTVNMTTPKITNADSGMKKATFTLTYKLSSSVTKAQKKAVFADLYSGMKWNEICGDIYYDLVDYTTGRCVFNTGTRNVTIQRTKKSTNTKTYKDQNNANGAWFYLLKTWTVKCTVTYPSSYKGLALIVMGSSYPQGKAHKATDSFGNKNSKVTYYQTLHYKKDKANSHCYRIS